MANEQMNKNNRYQLSEEEAQQLEQAMRDDGQDKDEVVQRLAAIYQLHLGSSTRTVAQAAGVSVSTIHRWRKKWQEKAKVTKLTQELSTAQEELEATQQALKATRQTLKAAQEERNEAQENYDNLAANVKREARVANDEKRIKRKRSEFQQRGSLDTLESLLPVIDDFDRAFENAPEDISDNPWVEGVEMIQRKFEKLLGKYQIEAIDPTGEPFDPDFHDAIGTDDSDKVESGHVTVTLQKGYRAGEHLLRPALVRVAS